MLKQNAVRSKNAKLKCRKFSTLQKRKIKMQWKISVLQYYYIHYSEFLKMKSSGDVRFYISHWYFFFELFFSFYLKFYLHSRLSHMAVNNHSNIMSCKFLHRWWRQVVGQMTSAVAKACSIMWMVTFMTESGKHMFDMAWARTHTPTLGLSMSECGRKGDEMAMGNSFITITSLSDSSSMIR